MPHNNPKIYGICAITLKLWIHLVLASFSYLNLAVNARNFMPTLKVKKEQRFELEFTFVRRL